MDAAFIFLGVVLFYVAFYLIIAWRRKNKRPVRAEVISPEPELETYIPQHILDMMDQVNIDFDDYVDRLCENPPTHLYAMQYKPPVSLRKPQKPKRQRPGNDPRELELRRALRETKWLGDDNGVTS